MDILYLKRIKQIYLEKYGNKSLLKGVSIDKIPWYVLIPPEPLRRQTALGSQEDPETFEEILNRIFWQSIFQKKMIIDWINN